jgi:hypothetical protein
MQPSDLSAILFRAPASRVRQSTHNSFNARGYWPTRARPLRMASSSCRRSRSSGSWPVPASLSQEAWSCSRPFAPHDWRRSRPSACGRSTRAWCAGLNGTSGIGTDQLDPVCPWSGHQQLLVLPSPDQVMRAIGRRPKNGLLSSNRLGTGKFLGRSTAVGSGERIACDEGSK